MIVLLVGLVLCCCFVFLSLGLWCSFFDSVVWCDVGVFIVVVCLFGVVWCLVCYCDFVVGV